jgi:hypothetical protein
MGEVEKMKTYKFAVIFILIFAELSFLIAPMQNGIFPSWLDVQLLVFLFLIFDALFILSEIGLF